MSPILSKDDWKSAPLRTEPYSHLSAAPPQASARDPATNPSNNSCSAQEIIVSSVVLVIVSAFLVALLSHYPYYNCCFHQLSAAIRRWDFKGLDSTQPKELWGFSYLSALVATITRLPDIYAIVLVSSSAFVAANYFCCKLWSTTVAAWFMVVNWWWIDGAAEGLTEPLFMALLLGSFLAVRKEQWTFAAILASAATVVRPTGVFALAAIGVVLINRQDLRRLVIAVSIAMVVAILYAMPLMLVYGNPLANVYGYRSHDWAGPSPVTIPLLPLIKGAIPALRELKSEYGLRFAELTALQILIAAWVLFVLAAIIRMAVEKRFWRYARQYPVEAITAGFFAIFLFSYNAPSSLWQFFPRFMIPFLPFLLLFLFDRLPEDRKCIWGVALSNIAISVLPKSALIHPNK